MASRHLSLVTSALLAALLLVCVAPVCASPDVEALPLVSAGRYVEAHTVLAPWVREHPEDLGSRYWLGRALLGAGQREAATQQFQFVLDKKPTSIDTRLYLAQALWELRRPDAAIAQLQELLRRAPQNVNAQALLDRVQRGVRLAPAIQADLGGGGIAFINGGLPIDPGNVDLLTYNVKDYTFNDSPADWMITSGTWATTNRWTCSPQWSWYGGYAQDGPATIWTKEEFAGDQVVDTYFGFKMGFGMANPGKAYKGGNDVCLTLCGDGANPASGYTFHIGADHNSVTRIMKGTQVLAESNAPEALLPNWNLGQPSTYQWHRRWWAFRARKAGDRLQLYLDNRLVLEARDPQPLPSGRVAMWVYDNGIIVPRIRIYYQDVVRPRTEPAGEEAWIEPTTTLGESPLVLTSASHASLQNDFEYGLGSCKPLDPETGAVLNLLPGGAAGNGNCLAIINRFSGGNFGATLSEDRLNAKDYSRLSFDYRLPPEAKVNFFLASHGKWYEIIFSGREDPSPRTAILGRIPGVVADNQWHHAEFDLLGALEQALGSTTTPTFQNLHLANFNNGDYLGAGFGGNPAGCTYYLDNLYLGTPRKDPTIKLAAQLPTGAQYSDYAVSLDQDPLGAADKPAAELPAQMTAPGPGLWYVHVQANQQDGTSAGTVTYAARVAGGAPTAAGADPAPQGQIGGGVITLKVNDPGGAGIDPASVAVELNGRTIKAGQPGVSVDLQAPAVVVYPAEAGITLQDGGSLQVKLAALADRAGTALAQPVTYSYTYSAQVDREAPPVPMVQFPEPDLINLDFESSTGGIIPYGATNTTSVSLDPLTAASGKRSLRVMSLVPGLFGSVCGAMLVSQPFDAGKYRLLSFDYRIPPYLAIDLGLNAGNGIQYLHMTNPDTPNSLGSLNIIADGKWHHVDVNLYELLRRSNPGRSSYKIYQMFMADTGAVIGNGQGAQYHLDNLCLSPVISAAQGLDVAWESPDLGGISAVSWRMDRSANATPPQTPQAPDAPLKLAKVTDFSGFLCLRTRDTAGNWSPTVTRPLLVDSAAPTATGASPAPNTRAAPETIRLALRDQGAAGIDPQSIVLTVGKTDYRISNPELQFNGATGDLTWSSLQSGPRPSVFPNGQAVQVALKSAGDFAGNLVANPPQWSWVMDYAQDKRGPKLVNLLSTSHPTFLSETFESGATGQVAAQSGCSVRVVNQDAASGQNCLVVRKTAGPMMARLSGTRFPAEKYPMFTFDYRLKNQVRVNLVVEMQRRRYIWALTGPAGGAVGQVPGVQADGQWHKAFINLAPALRSGRKQGSLLVDNIYLQEMGGGTPLGAEVGLDNLIVAAAGYGPVFFRWSGSDATGIQGVSYMLTQDPADVPPAKVMDKAMQHTFDTPAPGVWFLRIRAQDGAGNWGPVETYAVVNRNPV